MRTIRITLFKEDADNGGAWSWLAEDQSFSGQSSGDTLNVASRGEAEAAVAKLFKVDRLVFVDSGFFLESEVCVADGFDLAALNPTDGAFSEKPRNLPRLPAPVSMSIDEKPAEPAAAPVKEDVMKICAVNGCGRKVAARGVCNSHYTRWIADGKPEDMTRFLAEQAKQPIPRRRTQSAPLDSKGDATPKKPRKSRTSTPKAQPPAPAPQPIEQQLAQPAVAMAGTIDLPAGRYSLGMLGKYATLISQDGLVVQQVPIARQEGDA